MVRSEFQREIVPGLGTTTNTADRLPANLDPKEAHRPDGPGRGESSHAPIVNSEAGDPLILRSADRTNRILRCRNFAASLQTPGSSPRLALSQFCKQYREICEEQRQLPYCCPRRFFAVLVQVFLQRFPDKSAFCKTSIKISGHCHGERYRGSVYL